MDTEKEKALMSLGYRKMAENKYGKPIGYSLFIFEADKFECGEWFRGVDNKIYLMRQEKIQDDNHFLEYLKYFEVSYHPTWLKSNFEFLTREEEFSCLL